VRSAVFKIKLRMLLWTI